MIVEHYRLEFKIVYRFNKNAKCGLKARLARRVLSVPRDTKKNEACT